MVVGLCMDNVYSIPVLFRGLWSGFVFPNILLYVYVDTMEF